MSTDSVAIQPALKKQYQSMFAKVKKHDYVSATINGELMYGFIGKGATGSKKAEFHPIGSDYCYKVPANQFKHEAKPDLPEIPVELSDWKLVKYKEYAAMSRETIAFEAELVNSKGEKIYAENSGHGETSAVSALKHTLVQSLLDSISAAMIRTKKSNRESVCPSANKSEFVETYVRWLGYDRNHLVTFETAFDESYY